MIIKIGSLLPSSKYEHLFQIRSLLFWFSSKAFHYIQTLYCALSFWKCLDLQLKCLRNVKVWTTEVVDGNPTRYQQIKIAVLCRHVAQKARKNVIQKISWVKIKIILLNEITIWSKCYNRFVDIIRLCYFYRNKWNNYNSCLTE